MKVKGHTLRAWFNHLLFRLLPPRWYLRTQGIKLPGKRGVTVTITYHRQGEFLLVDKRRILVELDGVSAVDRMIFLWFEHGFCEPVPKLSPYIPRHFDNKRYYIPPDNILKMEWHDPVLKDDISIDGPWWRPE